MKIEIWMPIFKFLFFDSHIGPCFLLPVHESQRKPKSNYHRKTKNNQSQGMQGKMFAGFCLFGAINCFGKTWLTKNVFSFPMDSLLRRDSSVRYISPLCEVYRRRKVEWIDQAENLCQMYVDFSYMLFVFSYIDGFLDFG